LDFLWVNYKRVESKEGPEVNKISKKECPIDTGVKTGSSDSPSKSSGQNKKQSREQNCRIPKISKLTCCFQYLPQGVYETRVQHVRTHERKIEHFLFSVHALAHVGVVTR
jgi:hypothetical protein